MQTSRRNWIKQMGLATAGIGLSPIPSFAVTDKVFEVHSNSEEKFIALNSNENPYGPSPLAIKAMQECFTKSNRYHWQTVDELVSGIAKKHSVNNNQVLISAGSTEILDLLVKTLKHGTGNFVVANPSYTWWTQKAELVGLKKIIVPLTSTKNYNLSAMLSQITDVTQFVHICNPHNPTGELIEHDSLVTFVNAASKKTMVIVDEAYINFSTGKSLDILTESNPNLVVVKTFSKIYGLAGARIGYAISHAQTIERFGAYQTWANGSVSYTSRAAALASINDSNFVEQCFVKNAAARKYTIEELTKLKIKCLPSNTNFIYFSLIDYPYDYLERLKQHRILGTDIYEEEGKWSRITVGTMEEMKEFISALR